MSIPAPADLRCALPAHIEAVRLNGQLCQWPMRTITWALGPKWRVPYPAEALRADVAWVWQQISQACYLDFRQVEPGANPNITSYSGTGPTVQLDGAGGTLAWAELPCNAGSDSQLTMMVDEAENWIGVPRMFRNMFLHEFLHNLGLPHAPAGTRAVMAPMLDLSLDALQSWDIQQLINRYGRRPVPVPPTTPPAPGGPGPLVVSGGITINGQSWKLVPSG